MKKTNILEIKNLSVSLAGKQLLHDISMTVESGARHLISGHNGSGKSTLAGVIAGASEYTVDNGAIIFDGRDITNETMTTRALIGIFLGAQTVPEIPGLTTLSFLKHSIAAHKRFETGQDLSMGEFLGNLDDACTKLSIPKEWLNRDVNVGFSGGERKRLMLLRLIMTAPRLAILDEPDSGADATTQKQIADTMREMTDTTFIFISHQKNFTDMVGPTATTILSGGKNVIE